jgi:hypothetical protein
MVDGSKVQTVVYFILQLGILNILRRSDESTAPFCALILLLNVDWDLEISEEGLLFYTASDLELFALPDRSLYALRT